jgi:hypothetical protein
MDHDDQASDAYPISGDSSVNDQITDLLRSSGAFDKPPVDEARLYGGKGATLESTAKAYRENAAESRANRSAPDLDPGDDDFDDSEGAQAAQRAPTPPNLTTREGLVQAQVDLANTVSQIQELFQGGQISQAQFMQAMSNAESYALSIQRRELELSQYEIHQAEVHKQVVERWHNEMSQGIPEWNEPQNRDRIIGELRNFFGAKGIPEHIMDTVDHPLVLASAYQMMMDARKAARAERSRLAALDKKRQAERRLGSHNASRGRMSEDDRLRSISDLLTGGARR